MDFYWSRCESESPQVYWTLVSIQSILNNDIVWIVSIHPLISNFSSPLSKLLRTVLNAPATIPISVTIMLHCFPNSRARSKYLFFAFFDFYFMVLWNGKVLLLIITLSGFQARIRRSVCILKYQRTLCLRFSNSDYWFEHITFRRMMRFHFSI